MALGHNPPLDKACFARVDGAHVDDSVTMLPYNRSDDARPEVGPLLSSFGFFFTFNHLSLLLHGQIRELLVDYVLFLRLLWEDILWNLLAQLTEMAPHVRMLGHRTSAAVWARSYNRSFIVALLNDPVSESMDIPEALGTARLH